MIGEVFVDGLARPNTVARPPLSAWEGLDNGQIAVVLGCSRNAVRIRLFRARKRFAAELASSRTAPARHRENVPNGDLA